MVPPRATDSASAAAVSALSKPKRINSRMAITGPISATAIGNASSPEPTGMVTPRATQNGGRLSSRAAMPDRNHRTRSARQFALHKSMTAAPDRNARRPAGRPLHPNPEPPGAAERTRVENDISYRRHAPEPPEEADLYRRQGLPNGVRSVQCLKSLALQEDHGRQPGIQKDGLAILNCFLRQV